MPWQQTAFGEYMAMVLRGKAKSPQNRRRNANPREFQEGNVRISISERTFKGSCNEPANPLKWLQSPEEENWPSLVLQRILRSALVSLEPPVPLRRWFLAMISLRDLWFDWIDSWTKLFTNSVMVYFWNTSQWKFYENCFATGALKDVKGVSKF